MYRLALVVVLSAASLGCASNHPQLTGQAPPGISYRFSGGDISDANHRASQYCAQYKKRAELQGVQKSGNDNIAVFECN